MDNLQTEVTVRRRPQRHLGLWWSDSHDLLGVVTVLEATTRIEIKEKPEEVEGR